MKDYSVKKDGSYVLVSYNDTDFHEEINGETGDTVEVYDEYFKLDHVYVSPEARGNGLARSMIREVVESIRADYKDTRIVLAAMPTDDEPIDQSGLVCLYRSCGFHEVAGQEGSSSVIMEYTR
jgi:ribosomal protein S18 acetylase RimI-like enzyme